MFSIIIIQFHYVEFDQALDQSVVFFSNSHHNSHNSHIRNYNHSSRTRTRTRKVPTLMFGRTSVISKTINNCICTNNDSEQTLSVSLYF